MRNCKLLIFDLDGTTGDTISGTREALNRMCAGFGFPGHTDESVLSFVNYDARRLVRESLPADKRGDEDFVTLALDRFLYHYGDTFTMTRPYGGLADVLKRLSADRLLAVNSNKQDRYVRIMTPILFPDIDFVDAVGYTDGTPGKPDPAMALGIMNRAGGLLGRPLTPDECVYIGDSDIDFHTAKNAGMRCVSVCWGYRSYDFLRALGDQPIARTPEELYGILTR